MARTRRVAAVGYPHHVIQRGDSRRNVFLDGVDREGYLHEGTRTRWAFGTDDFVAELEAKLDRSLFPRKPGPKPKEAS